MYALAESSRLSSTPMGDVGTHNRRLIDCGAGETSQNPLPAAIAPMRRKPLFRSNLYRT